MKTPKDIALWDLERAVDQIWFSDLPDWNQDDDQELERITQVLTARVKSLKERSND